MLFALALPALIAVAPAKPSWIETLPEAPGRVYGLGAASVANTRALALKQASDGARADVLSRLRASIKAETRTATSFHQNNTVSGKRTSADASRSVNARTEVSVQSQAADLPGLTVGATYLDETPSGATLYALACLDVTAADQELRARYDTIAASLAAPAPAATGREIFHRIGILKKALGDLDKLDDLSSLLRVAGGDPSLREAVLKTRLGVERERAGMRSLVTFGFQESADVTVDEEVKGAVRTAILKEGMGWTDHDPLFSLSLRVKQKRDGVQAGRGVWWEYRRGPDFIMAQGTLSLTLVDKTGQAFESTTLLAKGVGVTELQAEALLLQDYRAKLTKAVALWLADMGR
jgi:hypothetical protein